MLSPHNAAGPGESAGGNGVAGFFNFALNIRTPMTASSTWRGHAIETDEAGDWRYSDNGQLVSDDPSRDCHRCGKPPTAEGHDACLGTITGAMNACCGHGHDRDAYVQYPEDRHTMTDQLPTTGALVSDPQHVQLHDSGWLRLPSGVEVAILWDSQHQLFARLGWAAADAWAREHGYRLPTVAELDERRYAGVMTTPHPLPTREMCMAQSSGVPYDDSDPRFRAFRDKSMRSEWWCRYHDGEVTRELRAGASVVNTKHHYDRRCGIYGWLDGDQPIQLPYIGHHETWTSYALTTVVVRDATTAPPSGGGDTEPAPDSGALPEPSEWRTLRRGMTPGRDVEAWQVQLEADGHGFASSAHRWAIDGDFGPATHAATIAWQRERELVPDGVVGPMTRAAIGTPPVPRPEPDEPPQIVVTPGDDAWLDSITFIPAANYSRGNSGRDLVVLHSTEGPIYDSAGRLKGWVARGIAYWFGGRDWRGRPVTPPQASAHYITGADPDPAVGVAQCVSEDDSAWTAGVRLVNLRSINIEQVGQAAVTDWADDRQDPADAQVLLTLQRSAAIVARACDRWSIPVREVSDAELSEARAILARDPDAELPDRCRGLCSHADITKAWGVVGGHQDPGMADDRRWPWELFLRLVRAAMDRRSLAAGRRT
jgi:hypothetical protein